MIGYAARLRSCPPPPGHRGLRGVDGNGRLTLRFNGADAELVDYQDYHQGKNMSMHDPAHPGEVLREWLPEGMTVTQAAQELHVARVTLSKVLNGQAGISAVMARRLAAWLGTSPDMWVNMQANYDLWQARKVRLADIKPLRRAA